MLDIDSIAIEAIEERIKMPISEISTALETMFVSSAVMATVKALSVLQKEYEEKLRWIPVEEKEPECELQDEGIFYSKYLEIKVKGYEHPFIGFYVLANDDQFFDFIHKTVDEGIKQDEITHYRFVL